MAYTQRFYDTFTETSDTNLDSHTPDTGASWTATTGNSGNVVVDGTNDSLKCPWHGGSLQYNGYTADISGSWATDHAVECTKSVTCGTNIGICVRTQNGSTDVDAYIGYYDTGSLAWKILRIDEGSASPTQLGVYVDSGASATDVLRLESTGVGSQELYVNGTSRITTSDSTFSGGAPGVAGKRTFTGDGIDEFKAYDQSAAAAGGMIFPAKSNRFKSLLVR